MHRKERFRMFHKELTTPSLRELHALIAKILREEDAQPAQRHKYQVRAHSDFREQADVIEEILTERGEQVTPIGW